ncbi:threonine--tRNA ligase [Candidatus Nomurabacteria bacterium RIFCSPLOWO2_02_40_28]|uniref:Threonine--tRNA ligase n=2 Tax=Candidatus Nomuraibacteriota TaxID=1752729 RepID=A0A837HRA9_9BACT|nr:MAG: Threonine-tRNA ligase [Candidatus Nomurabacteria bacterium GW2011_GWD2_39_12]KKR20526.1 MAG: Threonine-tRNA ligase [Candidatus Nomurabacteria bacterium GW2011_GWC2_39_41]KKR36751.1 MAG: Threonine-tRNA ligase [Candidatus Nomurabacteria bacterium GW2011_GWE2_40_10]KKR38448.1 MAG: Threonine-tRNA ligase [Candidatus Nomurabacteria bacterium GW2011_GWB1_40_11]KKR39614.1 MAG: Threonine-tRNA ligase [Parcubacteria group bacterium GW2011_GWC1_40_11]KKR59121.1 MAG: Threonine-tRNA ligase [Candidat
MEKTDRLHNIRHTLAHLLAASVRELYDGAQNAIGPSVDDGFYQDFDLPQAISLEDLPKIEKKMRELLKNWNDFERKEVTIEEAKKEFSWNPYKIELIEEFAKEGKNLTFYTCGNFIDLCKGGHLEKPNKELAPDCFKLDRVAGAYWRGDEKNKMLTRIYGLAFENKKELDAYITQREEAEKRDHKKLGKELGLLMFHETAPGMPYWLPKGLILYKELENYWRKRHAELGYLEIASPLVNKSELWKISGHWDHYKEDMFIANMGENEVYGIKPMNCPNAMIVFKSMQVSYKDLPLRLSDTDRLHRYERSGVLNGLLRCRSFQQDDSHNYVTEEMIEEEYRQIMEICKEFYGIFNLEYKFRLGTRPKEYLGDIATWNKAEKALQEVLKKSGKEYSVAEGDGAFYGPKIDIVMKDAIGREWQMGTIQLDFQQPQRFELEYTDRDGKKKTPVAIHRVIYGSLERFIGILIEHTAGAFPLWLAPVQVKIIPVRTNHNEYAKEIFEMLKEGDIRAELANEDENLGTKVRSAKNNKIPYWVVIGDKEIEASLVTLESRDSGQLGKMPKEDLLKKLLEEIKNKK